ncbi:MAG: dolichyl-diphosphooligosaccharide--protein glycosyltransferase subunit STT3 [Bacteroidetes bacterium]|nr:dolichyl-diphosphooligosaccharide--protein glycosyltransferase subunit STT3 [Bacteroidota bacterium]
MANFEIRPRFKRSTNLTEPEITELLQKALDENKSSSVIGYISDHHIFLKIPEKNRHYWSPELHLEVEEKKEKTLIRALFGPRPSVWFMYIFFYCLLGFISMVILIMGFSQLNLGLSARILWVMPIIIILFLLAFSTAKAGQKLGHDEMHLLYDFVEDALEKRWERI